MRYGAYRGNPREDMVWFRTTKPIEPGFYHRQARPGGTPDVCIAESVPALIMNVYPWIQKAQLEFQRKVAGPGVTEEEQGRLADRMTDQLVQRLEPDDASSWVDDPDWIKHLKPAAEEA